MSRSCITPLGLAALCLPLVVLVEYMALLCPAHWSSLTVTAVIRSFQILILAGMIKTIPGATPIAGFSKKLLFPGIRTGLIVSGMFGLAAAILGGTLLALHLAPLNLIRVHLPGAGSARVLFFVTAGVISPIAEEIVFRGILFSALRPWGLATAVLISTLIFSLFHYQGAGLPVVQCVGGIAFSLSFERSGHIVTPVIVHCLGNLALFSLSLL